MGRIGSFSTATALDHQALIQSMFELAMPLCDRTCRLNSAAAICWKAIATSAIGDDRKLAQVPPAAPWPCAQWSMPSVPIHAHCVEIFPFCVT